MNCIIKEVSVDEEKIGYIEYTLQHTLEGKSIYIQYFFLSEEFRGKGMFKKLFSTIVAIGKRRRINIFYLIPTDERTLSIYKKYGFVGDRSLMRLEL